MGIGKTLLLGFIYELLTEVLLFFVIVFRATLWLFFNPSPRKLPNLWITFKNGGLNACIRKSIEKFGSQSTPYNPNQNQLTELQCKNLFSTCMDKPLISVLVMLSPDTSSTLLEKCIQSVCTQYYPNWELVLISGKETHHSSTVKKIIRSKMLQENRIYRYCSDDKTPGAQLNQCLKTVHGRFIAFLHPHDKLSSDALTWFVWALNANPDAVWFYSDEDKISIIGRRHSPNFKPDFSAEFLLSNFFTAHLSFYSTDILLKTAGFTENQPLDAHYDIALRLSEFLPREKIVHIPRVLYHWRQIPNSAAAGIGAKPNAPEAGRKAVAKALERRNIKATVTSYELCQTLYKIKLAPTSFPKISIIIPTKNSLSLVQKCVHSIRRHTNYPSYEIVIINNASDNAEFLKYIKAEQSENRIRVIHYDKPFNHSEMNNIAVQSTNSDFAVFMNNDIEIISDEWLEQLVATAQMDKTIGVVGAMLLYPDGKVQHSGIILGLYGMAGHAHKYIRSRSPGYFGRLHALQEYSGITAALSLIRLSAFRLIGGFNAIRYPSSYNDVDLCIRLHKNGFRCVYNPMVLAIHYESKTRPITKEEFVFQKRLKEDYEKTLKADPFYNPNLTLFNEQFMGFRSFPVEEQISELRDLIPPLSEFEK